MKKQTRRKFTSEFKAKVAVEAVKNQQTLAELGLKFELSPVLISKWKIEFLENMSSVFEKGIKNEEDQGPDVDELYAQIGKLKVENEFLKKVARNWGYENPHQSDRTSFSCLIHSSAMQRSGGFEKQFVL